jgi:hypothetical protein
MPKTGFSCCHVLFKLFVLSFAQNLTSATARGLAHISFLARP